MSKSSLCNYSDPYIFVKETITITGGSTAADEAAKQADKRKKGIIFKNSAPFTDWH